MCLEAGRKLYKTWAILLSREMIIVSRKYNYVLVRCHLHPVGHWMRCGETAGKIRAVSLTGCWWVWTLMRLYGRKGSVTHTLLAMVWDETPEKEQCHSLAVCHKINMMRIHSSKRGSESLTYYWTWWDCLAEKWQCHSHTVGHGTRCDDTVWQIKGQCYLHTVGYYEMDGVQ